jgi:uncharacterized protein (DUF1684 family)
MRRVRDQLSVLSGLPQKIITGRKPFGTVSMRHYADSASYTQSKWDAFLLRVQGHASEPVFQFRGHVSFDPDTGWRSSITGICSKATKAKQWLVDHEGYPSERAGIRGNYERKRV